MEPQNNLEINGDLRINSLAELIAEIAQNKLNGSLRLTNATQKIAVYFDAGEVVFAVSNTRQHRLYEMLLKTGDITKEQLAAIPDFTNDLTLKENLSRNNSIDKVAAKALFSRQISEILKTALAWQAGDWTFSPLVRIKGDVRFPVNLSNLLIEHARTLSAEEIVRKFINTQESFRVQPAMPTGVNLSPTESFVFSRFEASAMPLETIQTLSGLPPAETCRILYALWLGGLLRRENWSAAFSERKVAAILSARLSLRKEEQAIPVVQKQSAEIEAASPTEAKTEAAAEEAAPTEKQVSLDEYLVRVEQATNFYELFGLAPTAAVSEIKQTYFSLAKRFHPDLFHKEADTVLLQKIQTSFTRLAQAYDTLKTESSRDVYDFRMRKELAEIRAIEAEETTPEAIDLQKLTDQATENFEQGFNLLMDGNYSAAIGFMARAVHFDGSNARYHAYYGRALASDDKQRHKAEAELQTAIKLDNNNAVYRIILAEFFVQFNLLKRAEGELKRLLAIHPNNAEARMLLDSLAKK
jgi:hypothetical protein